MYLFIKKGCESKIKTVRLLIKILLIEDDEKVVSFLKRGLDEKGYKIDFAPDCEKGLERGLCRYLLWVLCLSCGPIFSGDSALYGEDNTRFDLDGRGCKSIQFDENRTGCTKTRMDRFSEKFSQGSFDLFKRDLSERKYRKYFCNDRCYRVFRICRSGNYR